MRYLLILFIIIPILGLGCSNTTSDQARIDINTQEVGDSRIAKLNILEPALNSTTTEAQIIIKGETDQKFVYIADKLYHPENGIFIAPYELQDGLNTIPIYTSTSFTTTTINLRVTKVKQ